jgi:hypothetical protein
VDVFLCPKYNPNNAGDKNRLVRGVVELRLMVGENIDKGGILWVTLLNLVVRGFN